MRLFKHSWSQLITNLRLDSKIQLFFALLIVPITMMSVFMFLIMYSYNRQYDVIMTNAAKAGRFSIDFKEKFDQKIYFLFVGRSDFEEANPYQDIEDAKGIVTELINNTGIPENKQRAEAIKRMLENLSKYVSRIEENQKESGHYDENKAIWEKDVQTVTSLITRYVLEYAYYENLGMEELRDKINKNLGVMTWAGAAAFAALIPIALYVSWKISRSIAKPIHHLSDITNQVAQGDLSIRVEALRGAEVRALGDSLNIMIERIQELLAKVTSDQTILRKAELELLQAQINPHFLYNTLDTIIWLAEDGQKKQIVDMVGALSDFFRTSLNQGADMITLQEEERHVRGYMQIQRVRYQDILEYEIDIPKEFHHVMIPKITLQPLVENALYHGIKNKRGKGRIAVKTRGDGDALVISVIDNGAGMTEERFLRICTLLNDPRPDKDAAGDSKREIYGLYNVNERIRLKFGPEYGLNIINAFNMGVTVEIRIPVIKYPTNHKKS
ncbi:MAG: sensor histidine kinase [Clostridiales bacterium]|jgi:two-component system sensor histidine kinase YesM|nr:sensor histidine kinase [Clostridiales bacterium]